MLLETKKLVEDRAKAFTDARAILEIANTEDRALTPDEDTAHSRFMEDYNSLDSQLKKNIKSNELSADQVEKIAEKAEEKGGSVDQEADSEEAYAKAFGNFIRKGKGSISAEDRSTLETRAQSVGTDSEGGFAVPEAFSNELEVARLAFGGLREIARVIPRSSGAPLPWPTVDGTGNAGEWLAENAAAAEQDEVYGSVTFGAHTGSSKLVKVSNQMMQDSAFPMDSFLASQLGERIGRLESTAWITGSGSGQPTGVRDSATPVDAADDVTITFDDMITLKHSVDPAYRAMSAAFVLNDSTLEAISKLVDSDGQYLWRPSLTEGAPDTILGHRYVVDQAMADIGTGARSVLFGAFEKYIIMDINGIVVKRLDELFAVNNQTGFISFARTDGQLVDSGTSPVKALRHLNT